MPLWKEPTNNSKKWGLSGQKRYHHCSPANEDSAVQALILHKAASPPPYKQRLFRPWSTSKADIQTAGQGLRGEFPGLLVTSSPHSSVRTPWPNNVNKQSSCLGFFLIQSYKYNKGWIWINRNSCNKNGAVSHISLKQIQWLHLVRSETHLALQFVSWRRQLQLLREECKMQACTDAPSGCYPSF